MVQRGWSAGLVLLQALALLTPGAWPPLTTAPQGEVVAAPLPTGTPAANSAGPVGPAPLGGGVRFDGSAAPSAGPRDVRAPSWLDYYNGVRALAGLGPTTENTTYSANALLHSQYMVKNTVLAHDENPALPGYTTGGNDAGRNGNVALGVSFPNNIYTDEDWINGWFVTPFHLIHMVDPRLTQVGYASYAEQRGGNWIVGATFDVSAQRLTTPPFSGRTTPIMYPGNGATLTPGPSLTNTLYSYTGRESPPPPSRCAAWDQKVGAPIVLMLPSAVTSVSSHSVTRNGAAIESCRFSQLDYTDDIAEDGSDGTSLGRQLLAYYNAIVVMPKQPLTDGGTYAVSIVANGTTYTWTFCTRGGNCSGGNNPTPTPTSTPSNRTPTPTSTTQPSGTIPANPSVQGNLRFITPVRVLDTRPTNQADGIVTTGFRPDGQQIQASPFNPRDVRSFGIGGRTFAGTLIPSDVTGILANVTVVPVPGRSLQSSEPGNAYVTVYAGNIPGVPTAFTVPLNDDIPISFNFTAVSLPTSGPDAGTIDVFSTDAVDVVIDVVGYYSPSNPAGVGGLRFISPVRVVDTRPTNQADQIFTVGFNSDGSPLQPGPVQADTRRLFKIAGQTFSGTQIPANATGILAHITNIQEGASGGFVTLFPAGSTLPKASTLNPVTPIAFNSAMLGLPTSGSAPGSIAVFSKTTAHVAIDVMGYFVPGDTAGGTLTLVTPLRVLNTTANLGGPIGFTASGAPIAANPLAPRTTTRYSLGGRTFAGYQVPADVKGILASVTIGGSPTGGFLTLLPGDAPDGRPNVSTVNPVTPAAAGFWANPVPSAGTFALYLEGDAPRDVIVDLVGFLR